jgi:hypothetical protein
MKPQRKRAPQKFPVGMLMAQVLVIIALVLLYGVYQQLDSLELQSSEASARQSQLDLREAQLDQRRAALDDRQQAFDKERASLDEAQSDFAAQTGELEAARQALTGQEAALKADRARLEAAEQALASEKDALKADKDRAARQLERARAAAQDLSGARLRIAQKIKDASPAVSVDAQTGDVRIASGALFDEGGTALSERGAALWEDLAVACFDAVEGESIEALSILVDARGDSAQSMRAASVRAQALLNHARQSAALQDGVKGMFSSLGLSGARPGADGEGFVALRFYPGFYGLESAFAE